MANPGLVVGIRGRDQYDGEEMVRQHLPVVLAALLDVDHNDLLQPESPLSQHVGLGEAVELSGRPVGPELSHVQVVRRLGVKELCRVSVSRASSQANRIEHEPTQPSGQNTE
jgi:hypothetical protein